MDYTITDGYNYIAKDSIVLTTEIFLFSSIAVTVVGLLIGVIEVLFLESLFRNKSFGKKIVYKLLLYITFFFVIIFITYPYAASLELQSHFFDKKVWEKYLNFLTSYTFLNTNVQLGISLLLSLFYHEISENLGHHVLLNYLTGKYNKPTEEKRIFMFTDMRSSTSIAEKIGHIKYFELLKAYYAAFSNAIINHSGEVYQYVGDEIIISWKFKQGIKHNNSLNCFFAMKQALKDKTDWFQKKFGVVPDFKAGIHYGKVTTGEIGVLKKEIIFTGDVLNATARIQGLCNQYNVDLLISGKMLEALQLTAEVKTKALGEVTLRGKKESIALYTTVDEKEVVRGISDS